MILIKNSVVIDPLTKTISKRDLLIRDGVIKKISNKINLKSAQIIDAKGMWTVPAIVDMHVHTRVFGKEEAEDFESIAKAALSCGVTTVVAMPNTKPPTDSISILKKLIKKSKKYPLNFLFSSTITKKRKGKELVDIKKNSKYVCAFSDDGRWVSDISIMARALALANSYKKVVLSHCEYPHDGGCINEGKISKRKGVKGILDFYEYIAVWRDCMLSIVLNSPIHIQHVSLKKSIDIISMAKKFNKNITCETCPHYFFFTEKDLYNLDPDFKMNPPLRTEKDRVSIINAIENNTVDVIATDHAPHLEREKRKGIEKAPFGVIGIETLIGATITELYYKNKISPLNFISKMTLNPCMILNLKNRGAVKEGYIADLSIIDYKKSWIVNNFYSKSSNSPFKGKKLIGKNIITIKNGKKVYEYDRFYI